MHKLFTSDATLLLSFLCRQMPNLFKYIVLYSTDPSPKNKDLPSNPVLSSQQIEEARLHPSSIIKHTLSTVALTQSGLNHANHKINELIEYRKTIENALTTLLANDKG